LLTATDPLGNVTTNTYDANGNLLTTTTPKPDSSTPASVTTFTYDSKGELLTITDPLNNPTTLSYYTTGLLHTATDGQNNVTTFNYDGRGNRTDVYDALNNHTAFTYDSRNRLTGITNPDTSTVGFGYDYRGRRTSVTDGNGKVTQYAYDDADRLTKVTDANTNATQYTYDAEDNLTSITDANNHATSFQYDSQGRLTQTTFPSTKVETYSYDNVGNLLTKIDRKNQTISYAYDALDRLTSKTYPDSTSVAYSYDDASRLTQVQDPTGTYNFVYDNMGRLKQTTTAYSFVTGNPFTIVYGYDAGSNRKTMTDPQNGQTTYTYDTLNRLSNIFDFNSNNFGFSYDALSRRTQLTRPNGINTNYGYDSVSNLLSIQHQQGVNTLDGASYTYDSAGNRKSKTNLLNSVTSNFSYDNVYQLTGVTGPNPESYTYDPVGNRLTSQSVSNYAYNSSNELTAAGSATYTYDANGNTLTKTDSTGTTTYGWDVENRLISVQLPNGTVVTFKYDPFGRRIQKSGASLTNYVYDGAGVIEEVDASENLLAKYSQGAGVDEPLSEMRSGAVSYYQQDGLGSVTSLSSIGGALANTYAYDSFGNLTSSSGTITNPYQYTGRDYDPETGLRYYRARYYDATTGRFLSEDPLGFFGGRNFYDYTWNNPVNFVDPRGTSPIPPFIGPLPPVQTPPGFIVDLNDPEISAIAHGPDWPQATKYYGESHQCVSLTKHFAKLPCTDCWRAGPKVLGNDVAPGTAIATFNDNGRYPQSNDVSKNSGIYLGTIT
jgi:RHS repeat-associated protein